MRFPPTAMSSVVFRRRLWFVVSSITKWACRISEEWSELESPNSTCTFIGISPKATPNVTGYFRSKVIAKKTRRKCRLWWLGVDLLWNGLTEDQKVHSHSWTMDCRIYNADTASLAAFGRLQNVIEYCMKVRKTGPVGKKSNNSATVWQKITTNDTHINVCWDFQVE